MAAAWGLTNILFRGTGLNDLQVKLMVKQGSEEKGADNVSVKNRQWSSHKKIPLQAGTYTWQAQHSSDSGESDWTSPRNITITTAAFEFAEAGPVIGRPVVDTGESVLLRVQAVSTETGDGIEGLHVDWSVDGQAVMATTVTGPGGWTGYRYIPATAGKHLVIADLTEENEGVVVAYPFEVTALQRDAWAREFTLWLDGEQVDLAQRDLVLQHGQPHKLELKTNSGSPLIGLTSVALEDLSGAVELGLAFVPPLETPRPVVEGSLLWSVSSSTDKSGFFGLKMTSPKLPDRHLPGRLASTMLANEVEAIEVDGQDIYRSAAGMVLRPGVKRQLKLILKSNSVLVDLDFTVQMGGNSDVTYDPSETVARPMLSEGLEWGAEAKKIQSNSHNLACTSVPTVRPVLLRVRQVGATLDTTIPIMNGTTPVGESIPQGIAVFNRGGSHILKVSVPNSLTPVANLHIVLEHADGPDNLVSYSPALGQPRYVAVNNWDNDLKWTVTAADEAGRFRLKISCPELEMSSYINCEVR